MKDQRNPLLFLVFIAGLVAIISWLLYHPSNTVPDPFAPQLPVRSATDTPETLDESATTTPIDDQA